MKKFYSLLTLCFAFLGIATASAQDAPELSNEKCYTVKNSRSSWVTSASALKTINDLGLTEDSTDPNQQFAFLAINGSTYLYSVGQEAYVSKSGELSSVASDPVNFKKGNADGTFVVYFDGSHYVNIGGSKQMSIDGWSETDEGNSCTITAVADFDPTAALASANPLPSITNLSELSNEKLYTVTQQNHTKGFYSWAVANDAFVSSKQAGVIAGKTNDSKQQFAFITSNETTYLYHAGEKKFVNKDATLSATPVDAITLVESTVFAGSFVVKFDDSNYINIDGEGNMVISGWNTHDGGNSNSITPVADFDPTEVLQLLVPAPTEIVAMNPVVGEVEAIPSTVTLAFNNDIQALGVFQVMSATGGGGDLLSYPDSYSIHGKQLTLNIPADFVAPLKDLTIILQVMDTNGGMVSFSNSPDFAQEGMIFLYYAVPSEPVKSDVFAMVSAEPAAGVVEKLTEINVTFSDPNTTSEKEFVGGFDTSKEVILLDSWNDVVATATMEIVMDGKAKTTTAKFTLSDTISIPDTYTLVIPEGTVYNERFYKYYEDFGVEYGATYNPEIRLEYTVVAPTEIVEITPNPVKISEMPEAIQVVFNNEIKAVNVAVLQSSTILETIPAEYTIDYNVVTLSVPEQLAACQDLTVVLQVVDAQGKSVTYSNHSIYPEQEGMIFFEYAVFPATNVESISPACGHYEEMPTTVKLTFSSDIKAVEYGSLRTNATGRWGYTFAEEDYTISGKELTLNLPESLVAGQANMNITLGVLDANDMYITYASNPDYATDGYIVLEYTAPIKADFFALESSDPVAGEVEKLDVINVAFGNPNYSPMYPGQSQFVGGIDATKVVKVLNAAGDSVTAATMEIVPGDNGWNSNTVKFTLATPVTTAGEYTLVIPAATVYNEQFDESAEDFGVNWGAIYNPEIRLVYTIPSLETTITEFSPVPGEISEMPEKIVLTFSEDIQAVNVAVIQSMTALELPAPSYTIEGNVLTLNLPVEYTANLQDLTIVLQVIDVNGNPVTYSNHELYGTQPGMIFLSYVVATPDGINGVTVNGKAEIYTLDGRKVTNPTKGIYVINGKKVYVK